MSLTIYPRAVWRAARRSGPVSRRPRASVTEVFIHWPGTTGKLIPAGGFTRAQEREIMRSLQRQHMNANGWSDIGYNHVLFPNPAGRPRIYTARGAQYTPAAQLGHNTGTMACMVYMGTDDSLHESTEARLRSYVRWADNYTGHQVSVRGHGEVFGTECPGPALRNWVKNGRHR